MSVYHHLYSLPFQVVSPKDSVLEQLTAEEILAALRQRVAHFERHPEELLAVLEGADDVYDVEDGMVPAYDEPLPLTDATLQLELHDGGGENPHGYAVKVSRVGGTGIYDEVGISILDRDNGCVGWVVVGLDRDKEPVVRTTANGEGDGDVCIMVHLQRPADKAVELGVCPEYAV